VSRSVQCPVVVASPGSLVGCAVVAPAGELA
jgi:hypothetical protein